MGLLIRRTGTYSILVDGGRIGSRHLGMPLGGAADRAAWMLGNALVGNFPESPALEITLQGPTLEATGDHCLVISGAPFVVKLLHRQSQEQQRVPPGHVFHVAAGDLVSIHGIPEEVGMRGYLCVAGGFQSREWFHSATSLEVLSVGTLLKCPSRTGPRDRWVDVNPWPDAPAGSMLRLLPGTHGTRKLRGILEQQEFLVRPESNRMGLRLASEQAWPEATFELLSAPVVPGTVQLPSGGQPIVLGVDAQTIGGYPRLGHVIQADLDLLGQLRPSAKLQFQFVGNSEAERLRLSRREWLQSWLDRLHWSM